MRPITNFEKRMRIVFGLAFAVLLSTIVVSVFVISRLNEAKDWVSHTHQVVAVINSLQVHFGDARVSTKNYMLSHQVRHLAPRVNAFLAIDNEIGDLRALTADNKNQQQNIDATVQCIENYKSLTSTIIVALDKNPDGQARKFPDWADEMEKTGHEVGVWLVRMRQEEESLLIRREKVANNFVNQAYSVMPFMLALQICITTYIYHGVLQQRPTSD